MLKDLPFYQLIELKNWDDLKNTKLIREIDNTLGPVVVSFLKLSPISQEKVQYIEDTLHALVPSLHYPYPIYCLGTCPNYFGQLKFFEDKNLLPKFYFFKHKNTSKLHSELLHFNQIAQREYECINFKRAEEIKMKYSSIQKKIYEADCEFKALEHICNLVKKNLIQE